MYTRRKDIDLNYLGTFELSPFWWELYETKVNGKPEYLCLFYRTGQKERVAKFTRTTRAGIDGVIQNFIDDYNALEAA